jgi:hypothetical protein
VLSVVPDICSPECTIFACILHVFVHTINVLLQLFFSGRLVITFVAPKRLLFLVNRCNVTIESLRSSGHNVTIGTGLCVHLLLLWNRRRHVLFTVVLVKMLAVSRDETAAGTAGIVVYPLVLQHWPEAHDTKITIRTLAHGVNTVFVLLKMGVGITLVPTLLADLKIEIRVMIDFKEENGENDNSCITNSHLIVMNK